MWLEEERDKKAREAEVAHQQLEEAKRNLQAQQERSAKLEEAKRKLQAQQERAGEGSTGEPTESQALIAEVCNEFRDFLIQKNEQYGDSAIDPVRVFSNAEPDEQLKVRLDDKLSRLMRGDDRLEPDEDIIKDMLGYWILLQVIRRKAQRAGD